MVLTDEEARLREAAARSPRDAAARQALGRYLLDQGQPFGAVWELWAAHQLQPDDPSIVVQLAVGLASGQLYDEAVRHLEALAERQPATREGRVQLATLYIARLQPEKALPVLKKAPDLATWPEGQLALGQAYQALGQADPALAAYRRAGQMLPASDEPAYRLGRLLLRQSDLAAARQTLEAAVQQTGPQARLLTLLAEIETQAGELTAAERHLRAAVEADPEHVPAYVALGRLHHRQRRLKPAVQAYRSALALAPGDSEANEGLAGLLQATGRPADAHALRARAFRSRGLPHRAIQEYEALARRPEHRLAAALEMSLVLLHTQQKTRAVRVLEETLKQHPREAALYERLVLMKLLLPDRTGATKRCREWQQLEPDSVRPVWILGKIATDANDLAQALRLLERAAKAEPENMEFAVTLAEALLRAGSRPQLLRARELLEKAVARPPVAAKTYQNLGLVLMRLGEPDAARRAFLRALDRDLNESEPYANLVQAARQLGQPEQIRLWGPLIRSVEARLRQELLRSRRTWEHPDDPVAYRDLALFLLQTADPVKAESQLEEAIRLRPGWAEAERLLASVRRVREAL